jgi:hypothetical protein
MADESGVQGGRAPGGIATGDVVILKKNHPCGCNRFTVLRTGVDFKIRCEKCGHEVMVPRIKIEKRIRSVEKKGAAPGAHL